MLATGLRPTTTRTLSSLIERISCAGQVTSSDMGDNSRLKEYVKTQELNNDLLGIL